MKQIANTVKYSGMRKAVGKKNGSQRQLPDVLPGDLCRCDGSLGLPKKVNAEKNVNLTVNDYIIKAVSLFCREFPS